MMFLRRSLVCLCLLVLSKAQVETASRDELGEVNPSFVELVDFFACKRLFTRDKVPVGCGSDSDNNGDYGRLFPVNNQNDLDEMFSLKGFKRSILIPQTVLSDATLVANFAADERINAIFVATDDNDNFAGVDPLGTGLLETGFHAPLILLSKNDTELARKFIEVNEERGFDNALWNHGGRIKFYNGKLTVSSEFCLSINECDPLGGLSVWGTVGQPPVSGNTILVAVKIDSTALFHDLTFAARDVAGNVITLLAAASGMKSVVSDIAALGTQVMFAFFQGESFDGIGSKRLIFDIANTCQGENFDETLDRCLDANFLFSTEFNQLDLASFTHVLVLDNLISFNENNQIFPHILQNQAGGELISALNVAFNDASIPLETPVEGESFIPPIPIVNSFPEDPIFSGEVVVLTSYQTSVTEENANPFHFTRGDVAPRQVEGQLSNFTEFITSVSQTIAKAVITLAGAETAVIDQIEVDRDLVAGLEFCLTQDVRCSVFRDSLAFSDAQIEAFFTTQFATNRAPDFPSPPVFYPGVYFRNILRNGFSPRLIELFVRNFLAEQISTTSELLEGDEALECNADRECLSEDQTACDPSRNTSVACVKGKCICSSVFFHDAVTPALNVDAGFTLIPDADFPQGFESLSTDSIFTEPRFELPEAAFFQNSGYVSEILLITAGFLLTLTSYFCVGKWTSQVKETKYKLS